MMIPQRPNIVIRSPPEKENMKNLTRDDNVSKPLEKRNTPFQAPSDYEFIMYTNVNKCRYSSELIEFSERNGMLFEIKDVSKIPQSSLPKWLTGTPVVEFKGEGYCGDLAFNFVECLSKHFQSMSTNSQVSEPVSEQKQVGQLNNNSSDDTGCSFSKAFSAPTDCGENDSKYNGSEDLQKVMDRIRR